MIEVAQWKNDSFFPPLCGDGFHRTSKPLYDDMGCKLCIEAEEDEEEEEEEEENGDS